MRKIVLKKVQRKTEIPRATVRRVLRELAAEKSKLAATKNKKKVVKKTARRAKKAA